jgi:hypothetical protein
MEYELALPNASSRTARIRSSNTSNMTVQYPRVWKSTLTLFECVKTEFASYVGTAKDSSPVSTPSYAELPAEKPGPGFL